MHIYMYIIHIYIYLLKYTFTFMLYKNVLRREKRNSLICMQRKGYIVLNKAECFCGAFVFAACTRVLTLLSVVIII